MGIARLELVLKAKNAAADSTHLHCFRYDRFPLSKPACIRCTIRDIPQGTSGTFVYRIGCHRWLRCRSICVPTTFHGLRAIVHAILGCDRSTINADLGGKND